MAFKRMLVDVLRNIKIPAVMLATFYQGMPDLLVSPSDEDVGRTQNAIEKALHRLGLPSGVSVNYRGAIVAMRSSLASMDCGLFIAVILVYLVMVAQVPHLSRPLHCHVRGANGPDRGSLDAMGERHDAQHRVLDGRRLYGWDRGHKCHSFGRFRQ